MSQCKKCGAEIRWATTENGKPMPLDAKRIFYVEVDDKNVGRIMRGYVPHWATCPNADDFRKARQ